MPICTTVCAVGSATTNGSATPTPICKMMSNTATSHAPTTSAQMKPKTAAGQEKPSLTRAKVGFNPVSRTWTVYTVIPNILG